MMRANFSGDYVKKEIYAADPFQRIDEGGVGRLMEIGVALGRGVRKNLKVGICGEHGGEPNSVEFCHRTGLDYVSCSPYPCYHSETRSGTGRNKRKTGKTCKEGGKGTRKEEIRNLHPISKGPVMLTGPFFTHITRTSI